MTIPSTNTNFSPNSFTIVDGSFLLFRMFYGIPSQIRSKDGVLLNAVLGFCSAILKYLKLFSPKYFVVIFDSENITFRSQLQSDYKATREADFSSVADDDNPYCQYPIICKLLDALSIKHFESTAGYEADDVIATYCSQFDGSKYIITGDSDMLQLVDEQTCVYMDRGKQSVCYDIDAVKRRFGVYPANILDYKVLTGDKTDNVRGIVGIGPKTAASLINKYGGVDAIVQSIAQINSPSLQDKIRTNTNRLQTNKTIIALRSDVPISYDIVNLEIESACFTDIKTINLMRSYGYID